MKICRNMFMILVLFFTSTTHIRAQHQIVNLTTGNYWVYKSYSYNTGTSSTTYYTYKALGDTSINGLTWKIILKNNVKTLWYSDEDIFKIGSSVKYDKRILTDSTGYTYGYQVTLRKIDSSIYFGEKYRSVTYNSRGPSASASSAYKYGEFFGYMGNNISSMGSNSSSEELIGARIEGVFYGKLPPPNVNGWNIKGNMLELGVDTANYIEPFNKIVIYNKNLLTGTYLPADSAISSSGVFNFSLSGGIYNIVIAVKTKSGFTSLLSANPISFTLTTAAKSVSLSTGNVWAYRHENLLGGKTETFNSFYIAVGDTLINNIQLKKIKVVELRPAKAIICNKFWYADKDVYAEYSTSGKMITEYFNWAHMSTSSNFQFPSDVFKVQTSYMPMAETINGAYTLINKTLIDTIYSVNNNSGSTTEFCSFEKYGLKSYCWHFTYAGIPEYEKKFNMVLVSFKCDNTIYGDFHLPAPTLSSNSVKDHSLTINYNSIWPVNDISMMILYKKNPAENSFIAADSFNSCAGSLKYWLTQPETEIRIAYRTKDGLLSSLSESIIANILPEEFNVSQNYPNPFNPNTKIDFEIGKTADVTLEVINILGQRVYEETRPGLVPGYYNFYLKMSQYPSGIYIYRVSTSLGAVEKKKMILIK